MTENYGSPVDERAQAVHSEYFAKAVACDREYNIYNEDAMTGPMCRTIGGRGDVIGRRCRMAAQTARRSAASYFGRTGLPGQAGGAQAGQQGLAHSPLFTHTGSGDATRPGHVADDYNPQVPPQADPARRPDGEDVTLDSDL